MVLGFAMIAVIAVALGVATVGDGGVAGAIMEAIKSFAPTAVVLAGLVSLDGDGSTIFIITVSALLPVYVKLGLSPVVLTTVACLANGVLTTSSRGAGRQSGPQRC